MNHPEIATPDEWESLARTLSDQAPSTQSRFLLTFAYAVWSWQRVDLFAEIKRTGSQGDIDALRDFAAQLLEELDI